MGAVCAAAFVCGLAACDTGGHTHTYSEEWSYNETYHWHAPTCDDTAEVKDSDAHVWDEGEQTADPTCEGTGTITYTCTVCGYKKYEDVAATGHTYGDLIAEVAATCEETGVAAHYICSDCGKYFTSDKEETETTFDALTLPVTEHGWNNGVVTKEATCSATGVKTYTCSVCGTTKTEDMEKIAHTAGEAVIENEVAATCTEAGSYESVVYCSVCNAEISRETVTVSATGHTYGDLIAKVAATCEKTGVAAHYKCSVCGKYFTSEKEKTTLNALTLSATGHSWGEWTETRENCDEEGTRTRTCSVCGETQSETLAAGEHSWNDGVITTEATCTEAGVRTYTCTLCGETKTETIEAFGHTYGEWVEEVAATCEETETKGHYQCSACKKYFDADHNEITDLTIAVTEHDYSTEWSSDGTSHWHECTVCGDKTGTGICSHADSDEGTLLSHSTVDASLTVTNAVIQYTCETCGFAYTEEYDENLTAIMGGNENRVQQITADGTYITYVNAASDTDSMSPTGHAPAEMYFSLSCNISNGATYTVSLLYSSAAVILSPDSSFDSVYGDVDGAYLSVVLEYGESIIFVISTTDGAVQEDYLTSVIFSVEISDPPPLGSVDRPIALITDEDDEPDTITFSAEADEKVYYKLDPSVLGKNIIISYGDGVSVYYLGYADSLSESTVGTFVASGSTLALSQYGYITYLYVVSTTGEISFTVVNAKIAGTTDNPIELELGESYTTKEFYTSSVIESYTEEWYCFTPSETYVYILSGDRNFEAYVYTDMSSAEYIAYGRKILACSLTAGTTYYFKVISYDSDGGYTGTTTFTFTQGVETGYSNTDTKPLSEGEHEIDYSSDKNVKYYSYTATVKGTVSVTFTSSSTTDTVRIAYNSVSLTYTVKSGETWSMTMSADKYILIYVTCDCTLTISFEATPIYTVTFVSVQDGETVTLSTQTVETGKTVSQPSDPTYSGHAFAGWYSDEDLTEEFSFSTVITANTTVYAKWEEAVTYTVTFITKYGTAPDEQIVVSGGTATEPDTLSYEGYTFGGWYTDEDCMSAYDFTAEVSADVTLYAKWTEYEPTGATVDDPLSLNALLEDGVGTATVAKKTYYIYTAIGNGAVTVTATGTVYDVGSTENSTTLRGSNNSKTLDVQEGDTIIVYVGSGTSVVITFTPSEE